MVELVPVVIGVLIAWGGVLGWRERLSRSRGAGVRTEATLASDEAFRMANKIAGLPTIAGGGVGIAGGILAMIMPTTAGSLIAVGIALVGMFALLAGGGLLGHRAASTIPTPEKTSVPAGCAGCACGAGGCGINATA